MDGDRFSTYIPDRLIVLQRGRHRSSDDGACAMEAASWLADEPWSDHPKSVHPCIAAVARAANDAFDDRGRQTLWPLILASIGTGVGRARRPLKQRILLNWRLRAMVSRRGLDVLNAEALVELWTALLQLCAEHGIGGGMGAPRVAAPPGGGARIEK